MSESCPQNVEALIRALQASGRQCVLAVTGGGATAIGTLLSVPGSSRLLLAAHVPYAEAALCHWLRARPEHFCSSSTARAMAMAAFDEARALADGCAVEALVGVGCTASLVSDRPKRGPHRVYAAAQTLAATITHSVFLCKGARDRVGEEQAAMALVLNLLAEACGVEERMAYPLRPEEHLEVERTEAPAAWQQLLAGRLAAVGEAALAGEVRAVPCEATALEPTGRTLFPGAFHPRHAGHLQMAAVARARLGRRVEFEISVFNVDKPPLDYTEMSLRRRQFGGDEALWFTRAPTFVEKAELFPGATFVVGADTIVRIAEPRYYGSISARDEALARLADRGCRFLVFGRMHQGRFQTLADLPLLPTLAALCDGVDEAEFRVDLSSTELRQRSELQT
ncbi:MAG: hypothetical protein K6T86_12440 [Pirellulales bacterium]|nr:hypothetical protein [Pirellulales bacterium]